jgi:hypothetical protein
VTLSPDPPGIFRFRLAPAGTDPGPVGCPEAAAPAVCKAASALEVRPRRALSSVATSTSWCGQFWHFRVVTPDCPFRVLTQPDRTTNQQYAKAMKHLLTGSSLIGTLALLNEPWQWVRKLPSVN